jgi:hypothetical protein
MQSRSRFRQHLKNTYFPGAGVARAQIGFVCFPLSLITFVLIGVVLHRETFMSLGVET